MRRCLAVCGAVALMFLVCAAPAVAQRVEVEAGGGYAVGGGSENPAPSLPTFDIAAVVWPWQRWGGAIRHVRGVGIDWSETPRFPNAQRSGVGQFRYWTVTARRRQAFPKGFGMELGAGVQFRGRMVYIDDFPDGRREAEALFGFLAVDVLATRRVTRNFAVKAGVTWDFNFETNVVQPVVLGALRF